MKASAATSKPYARSQQSFKPEAWLLLSLLFAFWPEAAAATETPTFCDSTGPRIEALRSLRSAPDTADAGTLALPLADCLRSLDSEARDRVGYEVLTYWIRGDRLDSAIRLALAKKLQPWLALGADARSSGPDTADTEKSATSDEGPARAFAALILSELVRYDALVAEADRWSGEFFSSLLDDAVTMFEAERDERGLDSEIGWIHTLAHGGDLLWRLALHPRSTQDDHRRLLTALAAQLKRPDASPYVHNEGDRLARVVVAVATRAVVSTEELNRWTTTIADPGPLETWGRAFQSAAGMAQFHNTKQFLRSLADLLERESLAAPSAAAKSALRQLP